MNIDEYINSYRLDKSLGDQNAINAHLIHESLPTDKHVDMTVDKIINCLIKLLKALPKAFELPLKASNG